jgi:hypothetical protein
VRPLRLILLVCTVALWSVPGAGADVLIPLPLEPAGPTYVIGADGPSLDDAGDTLAFDAHGDRLVEGDTNNNTDVFVRDLETGEIQLASVATNGALGNGPSFSPHLSGDGSVVAFTSHANDLVPQDRRDCSPDTYVDDCRTQLYLHDLVTGETLLVSHNAGGRPIRGGTGPDVDLSDDGRFVVFTTYVRIDPEQPGDDRQAYVFDRVDRSISGLSVSSDGEAANDSAHDPVISGDGQVATFWSGATNLVPGSGSTLYLRDLVDGTTTRLEDFQVGRADLSDDGSIVAGLSQDYDVLILDRSDGSTTTIATPGGTYPEIDLGSVIVSGDGSTALYTWLDWIGDYPPRQWVIVDVATGEQTNHTWEATEFSLSSDGSILAFTSDEADRRPCAEPASLWLLDRTVSPPALTPPVFTSDPDVTLDDGRVRAGVPVRIEWEAQDEDPLRYFVTLRGPGGGETEELRRFNDHHATEQVARDRRRLGDRGLPYGVFACDRSSSTLALAPMFVLRGPQEDSSSIAYEGTWRETRNPDAWRNALRITSDAGAAATLSFDGTQVAWVARRGPDQGSSTVSVDGTVIEEVDLVASERGQALVVFRWRGAAGPHTIRVEATGSGPVSVDGFAVIEPTEGP